MREKLDVLLLCQFFYPENISSGTLPYECACDMRKAGWTVDVLCGRQTEYTNGVKLPRRETIDGVRVRRVSYLHASRKTFFGKAVNYFALLLAMLFRVCMLRRYRCVIVYTNPPLLPMVTSLANRFFSTKFVFVSYDVYPETAIVTNVLREKGVVARFIRRVNREAFARASGIVAISGDMKKALEQKGAPAEKLCVISNWYDDRAQLREEGIESPTFAKLRSEYGTIVLYSGNMGICQDMDTILQAALRLRGEKGILFLFCGHGVKHARVARFIEENALGNCRIYGYLTGVEYADILKAADLHLISLAARVEGLGVPSKTYSYLAAGRAVAAIMSGDTDIAKDIARYGFGFSVRQGDAAALSDNILWMSEHPQEAARFGSAARRCYEENYTRAICTRKYIALVKKVMEG